jgi:hypothetical protein
MQISLRNQLPSTASDSEFEQSIGLSPLGTPIFDDLTFPAGAFKTLDGLNITYQELKLVSVRFVVSQQKNIVRTEVSGRNGTVKEYNSTGDYVIKANANLSELQPVFPREELLKFVEITEVPQSLPIISKILNQFFGVNNIILTEFTVDPGNGTGNVALSFTLESDNDFDLNEFIVKKI